jgi:hypothetical protein
VFGHVNAKPGSTLRLEFSDGSSTDIALTWVGPPISAGFFEQAGVAGERMTALLLRGPSGAVIAKETELFKGLDDVTPCPEALPDGTQVSLPQGAEAAKARKLISFRATDGSPVYLWVMPRTGGGDCFVFNQGGGCRIPGSERHEPAFGGGLAGGASRILFFGQAKPEITTVELRFQNGERERLQPIDGFVLREITPVHYKRGTRLIAALALDRSGKVILTQRFQPQQAGVYPCKKPVNKGHGAHICP